MSVIDEQIVAKTFPRAMIREYRAIWRTLVLMRCRLGRLFVKRVQARILTLGLWACLLGAMAHAQLNATEPAVPPVPVRVVAVADVEDLRHGRYAVREFLDVYNDDYARTLEVTRVTADTWVGQKRDLEQENWKSDPESIFVPPATVARVAERQRIVAGLPLRNWWVRWLRFTVVTDRGTFQSNFIASPLKPPPRIESIITQPQLDSYRSPSLPVPPPREP
ncbi:MAG TPA: hypothetical protein PKO06_21450 [Candidatus Ozemobacteraceae bacterium]|nr:hypothetical protein [Candidatus Ozemobacteraceae bacterium]